MDADQLLEAARDGQVDVGPLLVSVYGTRLTRYLHSAFPDLSGADIEIVCEEAVEAALTAIARFDPALGSFDRWLRGFARYGALALRRRRGDVTALDGGWFVEASAPPAVDESLGEVLSAIVRELNEQDQLLLALRVGEGLPFAEISNALGASEAACRQRYLRIIRRLRAQASAQGLAPEQPRAAQPPAPTDEPTPPPPLEPSQ